MSGNNTRELPSQRAIARTSLDAVDRLAARKPPAAIACSILRAASPVGNLKGRRGFPIDLPLNVTAYFDRAGKSG